MVGPKRSGKGTIGRVLNRTVGEDNVCAPTLAGLTHIFGLQPLIHKNLAIIADARLGSRADQHQIAERLLSISGEDTQTIDRKYKNAWTGKLATRFLILTNELPRLADSSGALAGRFILLTLAKSFYGKEDPALTQKLLEELPGILNWSIRGRERLQKRGHFVQPKNSQDALRALEDLSSPVGAFLRDRCEVQPRTREMCKQLFRAWRSWCEDNGTDPGTAQTFGRDLRAAVPTIKTTRPRVKGRKTRFYEGITLKGHFI